MNNQKKTKLIDRQLSIPLHRQIAAWLQEQIESGVYTSGAMLPSTKSLCEQLGGVNHLTVRQAIQTLTKMGLLHAIKGKGTFVCDRSEVATRTTQGTIGMVCSSLADGFAHQIVIAVEATLRAAGYELILCNSDYSVSREADHLRRLHARGVDGVLLLPYMPPANLELIETLVTNKEHSLPVVCLDRGFKQSKLPLVDVDNQTAAYDAVRYLISLGHRSIGFIVSSIAWIDTIEPIHQRFIGYRKALRDHGITFRKELIQEVGPTLASMRPQKTGLEHYGYQAMHKLLMLSEPPTAVFLLWDELAPGAILAIKNSNLRVPEDISLIGFNDDLLSRLLATPLTTVHQPADQIGHEAAQMIISLVKGETVQPLHRTLATHLMVRATTARLGGSGSMDAAELCSASLAFSPC